MSELFERVFSGFTLKPDTPRDDLVALAKTFDVRVEEDDSWDDLFARLFIEKIESDLGRERPLIVHGYPSSQAALARLRADGFADRFEVYWRGLEIANAFHELNDPKENRQRFEADRKAKVALQKKPVPIDEDFLQALEYGMPPSGGIALGLDRLFMAILKIKEISQTRPFPIQNE